MNNKISSLEKAFTLIELLVVIAIIAILSIVVVLTLNPQELLRQSRDSDRISDLSITKSAISFYLLSVANPSLGSSTYCYVSATGSSATSTSACQVWFPSVSTSTFTVSSTARIIDGTGWIPVPFSSISLGGSPMSNLPVDPLGQNGAGNYFYAYTASTTGAVFKLDAHMESAKYRSGGSNDVVSNDGGKDPTSYEVGNNLNL